MEALLLDNNFESLAIIDTYKSFIWTDRYDEAGDFELCLPMSRECFDLFKKGYYLWNSQSEHVMIIETVSVESDEDDGAVFLVSGRSLESILDRRIVWNKTTFSFDKSNNVDYKVQDAIRILIEQNITNEDIGSRRISNFVFNESDNVKVNKPTIEAQYLGEDLYSIVSTLCKEHEIGFKVTLSEDNQFIFELYAGVDRSYEQIENPYVIFSPEYDNVMSTKYLDSDKTLKNVTLVVGETTGSGDNETRVTHVEFINKGEGIAMGLERREAFTDASSTSADSLTAEEYKAHLRQKGIDTLIENTSLTAFEGEVDAYRTFKYGEDYFVGDIVQIVNEYGHEGRACISEVVMSSDSGGTTTYPTFKTIEEGVYDTDE